MRILMMILVVAFSIPAKASIRASQHSFVPGDVVYLSIDDTLPPGERVLWTLAEIAEQDGDISRRALSESWLLTDGEGVQLQIPNDLQGELEITATVLGKASRTLISQRPQPGPHPVIPGTGTGPKARPQPGPHPIIPQPQPHIYNCRATLSKGNDPHGAHRASGTNGGIARQNALSACHRYHTDCRVSCF